MEYVDRADFVMCLAAHDESPRLERQQMRFQFPRQRTSNSVNVKAQITDINIRPADGHVNDADILLFVEQCSKR